MRWFWRTLWRGLCGRCPVCGMGHMFRAGSLLELIEGCAQCGRRFEGMGNQSAGAMGISLTLTTFLGVLGGIALVLWLPDYVLPGLIGLLALLGLVHLVLYRLSRGVWIGILVLTGAINEDERRDEFYL